MSLFKDVNVVQSYVSNWERAKQFYADALGWPVAFLNDETGWMEFSEESKTNLAINRWEESSAVVRHGGLRRVLRPRRQPRAVYLLPNRHVAGAPG